MQFAVTVHNGLSENSEFAGKGYDERSETTVAKGNGMFEPTDKIWQVRDPKTGTTVSVNGTVDIDIKAVVVEMSDGREVRFGILIQPKEPNSEFNICLLLADLNGLAKFRNGNRQQNTEFVRYVLSGLSVLHSKRPIELGRRFYTDRSSYLELQRFEFDVPDEEEIGRL